MKVQIETKACQNARDCRLCLDRCPENVFGTYPRRRRAPGVAAGDWVIVAMFASECSGCRECEQFCPTGAITIH
jgi:ferredoxin